MSPLDIALVVLVVVAIWAVVELALTIRKARASVDEVTTSANETIAHYSLPRMSSMAFIRSHIFR